jgi:hypothetical protein
VIVEWALQALTQLMVYVGYLTPTYTEPDWAMQLDGPVGEINSFLVGLGVWLPTGALVTVFDLVLSALLIGVAVKVVRIIASYVTLGGGSAG